MFRVLVFRWNKRTFIDAKKDVLLIFLNKSETVDNEQKKIASFWGDV